MANRMKANTWTKSRIPQPTLVRHHGMTKTRESGGNLKRGETPLTEISNEPTIEESKSDNALQCSTVRGWKTVKPNIALKASKDKEEPFRKVKERLETQESQIEQAEQTTKSYEEQQRQYQQQMDILLKDIKYLEEQETSTKESINSLEEELILATRELETFEQNRKQKEEQLDELKVQISVIQGQIQVEETKTQSIQSRIEEQRAMLSSLYEEELSLQKQIQSERNRNQDELYKMEEMNTTETNLETEITKMKEQKEEHAKLVLEQENEREETIQQLERLKDDFYRQEIEIHQKEEEERAIEKEISDLDLQGEQYPQRKNELEQEIAHLKDNLNVVKVNIYQLKASISQRENEYKAQKDALEDLRQSSERVLSTEKANLASMQSQLEHLKEKNKQIQHAIKKKQDDAEYFNSALDQQRTLLVSLRNKLSALELRLDEERNIHLIEQQKLNALQERMQTQQGIIDELKEQRRNNGAIQEELQRKVYEMRPNMQVFCKLEPNEITDESTADSVQHLSLDMRNSELVARKMRGLEEVSSSIFPFDQIFDTDATHDEIFRHCTAFIDQIWKTRNVCIFSYAIDTHQRQLFFDANQGLVFLTLLHLLETLNVTSQCKPAFVVEFFRVWEDKMEDIFHSTWDDDIKDTVQENTRTDTTSNLTSIEISNATQLQERLVTRMSSQHWKSQQGHFVFRINIKDEASPSFNMQSGVTFIHLQAPDIQDKKTLQNQETEKNFVSLLHLLTQLANREKTGFSNSPYCILPNKLFECLSNNPKLLSILQLPKSTRNIQSTLLLLNLGQKLNCCEIIQRKAAFHR